MLTPTMPARPFAPVEPVERRLVALVVEAEPIDERAVGGSRKSRGARIARLRQRRHRADLDEAEAEAEHRVRDLARPCRSRPQGRSDWENRARARATGEPRVARLAGARGGMRAQPR